MKAIRIHRFGGPEVLSFDDVDLPPPAANEARVKTHAIGVNFIDTYHRSGLYPLGEFPVRLGQEGAGIVEAVGANVTHLKAGDRVAWGNGVGGSYAEVLNAPAGRLVKLPENISFQTAAGAMLKGMTVHMLLTRVYPVKAGDPILIHAAAGGVGLIACQWAKALGATVIGTVGSEEKAKLARENGCDHTILYRSEDIAARVKDITGGAKLPVVYDSVGKDTLMASLDCLRVRGLFVTFGNASGPTGPIDPLLLLQKGSLFMTRPTLHHYVMSSEELQASANALFGMIASGKVKIAIGQSFALADARQAHEALHSRATTGATILLP
jgi:NADPH2:quinone reductase